jgi:hypothetical protein
MKITCAGVVVKEAKGARARRRKAAQLAGECHLSFQTESATEESAFSLGI